MKLRLLLICGIALVFASAAGAAATKASITLNQPTVTSGSTVDFTVVVDRGSTASVSVECFTTNGSVRYYAATDTFTVNGPTVSPSLTLYTATSGGTCTARLYRWAQKQMVAASTSFPVS